jgi:hypothetical protein
MVCAFVSRKRHRGLGWTGRGCPGGRCSRGPGAHRSAHAELGSQERGCGGEEEESKGPFVVVVQSQSKSPLSFSVVCPSVALFSSHHLQICLPEPRVFALCLASLVNRATIDHCSHRSLPLCPTCYSVVFYLSVLVRSFQSVILYLHLDCQNELRSRLAHVLRPTSNQSTRVAGHSLLTERAPILEEKQYWVCDAHAASLHIP